MEVFIQKLLCEFESLRNCLQQAEEQLVGSRAEVGELRCRLAEVEQVQPVSSAVDPALQQRMQEIEDERRMLELELETVRTRSVEMIEELTEQKRQIAEERSHWAGELKHMRRLLEKQSEGRAVPQAENHPPAAAAAREHAPANAARHADPVLGSVMAQFEMLQKDVARRRASLHNVNS